MGGGDFHGVKKSAAIWCWSVQFLASGKRRPEQKNLIGFPPEQKKMGRTPYYKDESTDLWTLPINGMSTTRTALPQSAPGVDYAPHTLRPAIQPGINLENFTHSVKTRANGVKFAHQLLCNPKKSTLLKAVRKGFLKGCPNLSEKLILKYLNPSPATAKGRMKRPRQGIKSTRPKLKITSN